MYPLAVLLSHLRPRFADLSLISYILGNYGHVRSQGGRHSATASPPLYLSIYISIYIFSILRIASPQDWHSLCSPRFEALLSTRDVPFRWILLLPCPPASTATGEGLPCGLLKGSCGRRKRRRVYAKPAKCRHAHARF